MIVVDHQHFRRFENGAKKFDQTLIDVFSTGGRGENDGRERHHIGRNPGTGNLAEHRRLRYLGHTRVDCAHLYRTPPRGNANRLSLGGLSMAMAGNRGLESWTRR